MENNRFKTSFQLCLPIMVLCGMWVISNLLYLYIADVSSLLQGSWIN